MKRFGLVCVALCSVFFVHHVVQAQPLPRSEVPAPLQPWVAWALDGDATYGCTRNGETFLCAWPGRLTLALDESGGTFTLDATSDRRVAVTLPGDAGHWPLDVRDNGQPIAVLTNGANAPYVELTEGAHRLVGRFGWRALPETLQLPREIALVTLSLDGTSVQSPHRDGDGHLWLRAHEDTSNGEDLLELEVQRRINDAVPLAITTRLVVHASGRSREVELPSVLLAGSVAAEVQSDLPVQLSETGTLKIQVRAGTFTISVLAYVANPGARLAMTTQQAPWPAQEVWVWVAAENERQVEVSGAPSVDPARTSLPDDWRASPAFLMSPGTALVLTTTRRGEPNPPPNQLSLARSIYLDPNGAEFFVRDQLQGTMNRTWRLDLLEGNLEHINSAGVDQLITQHAVTCGPAHTTCERPGLDIRTQAINLRAESRLPRRGSSLPAVAWSEDMQSLSATLHLPPGWSLFSTSGVDVANGTWMESWTLWGFFFVLIVSIAFARVFGVVWGLICALGLTLTYPEPDAPTIAWLLFIATIAVWRALKDGRLRRFVWLVAGLIGIVLTVQVAIFSALQLRYGLHPQLQPTGDEVTAFGAISGMTDGDFVVGPAAPPPEQPSVTTPSDASPSFRSQNLEAATDVLRGGAFGGESDDSGGGGRNPSNAQYQNDIRSSGWMDPSSIVQTGRGMPMWQHKSLQLSWSGPVRQNHSFSLHLIPPWLNRVLAFLRVGLILALLIIVFRKRPTLNAVTPDVPQAPVVAAAATAFLLCVAFVTGASAQEVPPVAGAPSTDVIADLRARLTRPPLCGIDCVDTSHASLRAIADTLTLDLSVQAGAQVAYPLPGPADTWTPTQVLVDGRESNSLVRVDDGVLMLRLSAGAHAVHLAGPLAGRDAVTLTFESEPHTIDTEGQGWAIEGMAAEGDVTSSVQLRRTMVEARIGETAHGVELPPWYTVTRNFNIGVTWTITTTVHRITPPTLPTTMRVPLLPGESVTTSTIVVEGRNAVITLAQGESDVSFESSLAPSATINLRAETNAPRSDKWVFACTPLWHCTFAPLAPVATTQEGALLPEFHPWPGEQLQVSLTKPTPAPGQSFTVDSAHLTLTPGVRMTHATLAVQMRTSQSQPFVFTLPHNAEVQSLTVGGARRAVQKSGDRVSVAIQPGATTIVIEWQEERGWSSVFTSSRVLLNGAPANAHLVLELPADRLLIWTSGPAWGPAILFWAYLILVLLFAFAIGRLKSTPLGYRDALLLGLGLTQVPPLASIVLVGWFFAMAKRAKTHPARPFVFNLTQLGLVAYTFVAACILGASVYVGLVVQPDMQVAGNGSTNTHLHYYVAGASQRLPEATITSAPIWVWRVIMLLWALWLAERVVRWARFAWISLTTDGGWRKLPPRPPVPFAPPVAPPPPASPPPPAPPPSAAA
ncbi:MAG: hypothetical protein IPK60_09190 [Sandaracinaceae bacterium]|nr:hypothetical protein [Sandaracinaceae bacterium]